MRSVDGLREAFYKEMEAFWPEFQAMSGNRPDGQLYDVLEKFTELADARGLMAWREVTEHQQEGQPCDHENALAPAQNRGRER